MLHTKIKQNIELLQWFYRFLYLGKFLEDVIKKKDLSASVVDLPIRTSEKKNFVLKGRVIKKLLANIYAHPDKKNIFWYMVEINSFRGIFSVTREMIDTQWDFQTFLQQNLKDSYFSFEQVIRFLRNVLNHIETADITLKVTDFVKQKDYILRWEKMKKIVFDFKYAEYFTQWKWSKTYGLDILIDFEHLKEGQKVFDIISPHQMYLLAELCFNLSEIFRAGREKIPLKK